MIPCIIPARAGSKGIPLKNVVPICGKPLIAWSIEHALASQLIDEVVVATDFREVVAVAQEYRGVKIHWRSPESATDEAPSEAVLLELVRERYVGADAVVFLQATSPMRRPHDIDRAIKILGSNNCDSVFSARLIDGYTWEYRHGVAIPRERSRPRRQDATAVRLEENGSIYVFRPQSLIKFNSRHGERPAPYIMHALDSFQVDEHADVEFIEALMGLRFGDRHATEAA